MYVSFPRLLLYYIVIFISFPLCCQSPHSRPLNGAKKPAGGFVVRNASKVGRDVQIWSKSDFPQPVDNIQISTKPRRRVANDNFPLL